MFIPLFLVTELWYYQGSLTLDYLHSLYALHTSRFIERKNGLQPAVVSFGFGIKLTFYKLKPYFISQVI